MADEAPKQETPAEGQVKKNKKINNLSPQEIDSRLAELSKKKSLDSRYAIHLAKRKKAL